MDGWCARVVVPYDAGFSDNRVVRRGRGRTYTSAAARIRKATLVDALRAELEGQHIAHNRLWLGIVVFMEDHRGDALNVLKLVADAAKVATGLDDRWFTVRGIEWGISKDRPRLVVWVGQDQMADVSVCGLCGSVLDFEAFARDRSRASGRGSWCRSCAASRRSGKKTAPQPVLRDPLTPPWK